MNIKFDFIKKFEKAFFYIPVSIIFVCFLFIFLNINKGFDLTDQSYSLLRSLYPNLEIGKITYFGYINNLTLKIFKQDLNFLIFFNICLLIISFINLSIIFQKTIKLSTNYNYKIYLFLIIALLGVINYYSSWELTPNYDYYNLLGIVIFLSGLLCFYHKKEFNLDYNFFYYSPLIILGLLLCIISKPSAFLILSLLLIFTFLFVNNKKLFFFIHSTFFVLVSIFLFIIFLNSINITIKDYLIDLKYGSYLKQLQDPRYEIQFIVLGSIKQIVFFLYQNFYLFIFIPIIIFLEKKFFVSKNYLIIFFSYVILLTFGSPLLTISTLSFYLVLTKFDDLKKNFLKIIFLPFILLCCYLSYSIGTNSNFVLHLKKSDFLLFLLLYYCFTFLKIDEKYEIVIKNNFLLIVILIYTISQLANGLSKPHRLQGSVFDQDKKIKVKSFNNNFYIDKINEDFILNIQKIFWKNGWNKGDHLIELSGRYPGFNIILDAKYVSKPWYLGGYKDSTNFVRGFFIKTDKNLIKRSWIITSNYEYGISKELLKEFDIDLEKNYYLVDIFADQIRDINFSIYKPIN